MTHTTTDHRISARIVADSINPNGNRLVTWQANLPFALLPEMLTHREFSRNFMSLRAVPQAKLVAAVREAPFFFAHLGLNQKGMQALEEEIEGDERRRALMWWHELAQDAAHYAEMLAGLDLHKQTVNRALAPFLYAKGVVSATSRAGSVFPAQNFFALRARSSKVEPHMHELAWCMADAVAQSEPVRLSWGGWHLPYCTYPEQNTLLEPGTVAKASAMRCARVSYGNVDGAPTDLLSDAAKADEALLDPRDTHGSPFEHQAQAFDGKYANYDGFRAYRHGRIPDGTFSMSDYFKGRVRNLQPGIPVDWTE